MHPVGNTRFHLLLSGVNFNFILFKVSGISTFKVRCLPNVLFVSTSRVLVGLGYFVGPLSSELGR